MPKVFIIILNWNGYKDTIECLNSLRNLDYPNYEVVVVDNGSTDTSVSEIKNHLKPQPEAGPPLAEKIKNFILIENKKNLGFSGGNNAGIKYAMSHGTDYVLLLNNDAMVEPHFLKKLVKAGEADKKIGVLGPKIYFYDKDEKTIWSVGGKLNKLFTKGTLIGYNKRDLGEYDKKECFDVDYVSGTCLLIKSEVIRKIGLLEESYFLYYEDVEWNIKAHRAGYRTVIVPASFIWHKPSKSAKEGSPLYVYYHFRNSLIFAKRNAPFVIFILACTESIWRLFKQFIKLFIPQRRENGIAGIRGIADFYLGKKGKTFS